MKIGTHEKILILFIIGALALRLLLVNQDISVLLNKFLSDDTYYAYEISQNIIEGEGIVFNDNIPTNGFHPLYNLGVLVPLFKIFSGLGINAPIYASLVAVSIINIGTSILLYLIVSRLFNKEAGLLSSFIWLFNPYVLFVSFIGLETSMQVFLIALLLHFILGKERSNFSVKNSVVIGFLIGLIFLSRMDGVFVGIGLELVILIRKIFQKGFKIGNLPRLFVQKDLIAMAIVALLVVSPWLLWSFFELNRITPTSGEATHLLASANLSDKSYVALVKHAIFSTVGFIVKFFLQVADTVFQGVVVLFLALIPLGILLIKRDKILFKATSSLDFLLIASVLIFVFYWFYQLGVREWYSMFTSFLITIIFSISLVRLGQIKLGKFISMLLISALMVSFVFGGITHYQRGNYPQEKLKWEVANYINENILANETVGSFNTGVYQYYTPKHDVLNLDGVVNPESLEAMKTTGIESYILEKNIKYIVDRSYYADQVDKSVLSLEPVKTFELRYDSYKSGEGVEVITLFRVVPTATAS